MILSLIISMDYISLHSGCLSNKYLRTFSFIHDVGLRTKHFVNWKEKRYKREFQVHDACDVRSKKFAIPLLEINLKHKRHIFRGHRPPPSLPHVFLLWGKTFLGAQNFGEPEKGAKGGKVLVYLCSVLFNFLNDLNCTLGK